LYLSTTQSTDGCVASLSAHCVKLETLSLAFCNQLTDDSLDALAAGCGYLRSLNLHACAAITNEGILHLTKHLSEFLVKTYLPLYLWVVVFFLVR
jgi:hypothetical protein